MNIRKERVREQMREIPTAGERDRKNNILSTRESDSQRQRKRGIEKWIESERGTDRKRDKDSKRGRERG